MCDMQESPVYRQSHINWKRIGDSVRVLIVGGILKYLLCVTNYTYQIFRGIYGTFLHLITGDSRLLTVMQLDKE